MDFREIVSKMNYKLPTQRVVESRTRHVCFDRKTFRPQTDRTHRLMLSYLRRQGAKRADWYLNHQGPRYHHTVGHLQCCCSVSMREYYDLRSQDDVLLDIGCGDSPDRLIIKEWGGVGFGLDLVAPDRTPNEGFVRGDAVEGIPFANGSIDVVVCHAMVDLIPPIERALLYDEISRVLTPSGLLVQCGQSLANGYGYHEAAERTRIKNSGYHQIEAHMYQHCCGSDCWCQYPEYEKERE